MSLCRTMEGRKVNGPALYAIYSTHMCHIGPFYDKFSRGWTLDGIEGDGLPDCHEDYTTSQPWFQFFFCILWRWFRARSFECNKVEKNPKKCLSCSFVHIHHQCFVLVGGVLARNWEQDHDHKLDDCTHMETKKQSLDRIRSTKSHIITLVYVDVFCVQESEKWCKMITLEFPSPQRSKLLLEYMQIARALDFLLFFHQKRMPKDLEKLDRMHMNEERVSILKPKSYIPAVLLPMNKTLY